MNALFFLTSSVKKSISKQRTLKSMCERVDDDSACEEADDIGTEVACDVLEIPGNDGDRGPGVGHE